MIQVGVTAELVLAEAWVQQRINEYQRSREALCLAEMVAICMTVRADFPSARYVLLEDSDQGYYRVPSGIFDMLPDTTEQLREFDREPEDYDYGAYDLRDEDEAVWGPFTVDHEVAGFYSRPRPFLDINVVLLGIPVPWQRRPWNESDHDDRGNPI